MTGGGMRLDDLGSRVEVAAKGFPFLDLFLFDSWRKGGCGGGIKSDEAHEDELWCGRPTMYMNEIREGGWDWDGVGPEGGHDTTGSPNQANNI